MTERICTNTRKNTNIVS